MWRAMVVVIAVGCLASVGYVLRERRHIDLGEPPIWSCRFGSPCEREICVEQECFRQDRVACFASHRPISDDTRDTCWDSIAACDDERASALKNRDLDDIGDCRVISAARGDRESYDLHVRIAAGMSLLAGLLLIIRLTAAYGARQGRRAS